MTPTPNAALAARATAVQAANRATLVRTTAAAKVVDAAVAKAAQAT